MEILALALLPSILHGVTVIRAPRQLSTLPAAVVPIGLGLLLLTISACATVPTYQRERFTHPEMNPAEQALEDSFHVHIESAREAGFGGHGAQGGGCGCG